MPEPLLFDVSQGNDENYTEDVDITLKDLLPEHYIRKEKPDIPTPGEPTAVRHFIKLSNLNYHVDKDFYPLGSCTMKYNPKVNEDIASLPGFAKLHPYQPEDSIQGALQIIGETQDVLGKLTGFPAVSLQPVAGAHSELVGILILRAFLEKRGNPRKYILVPDSAHGTNPSSSMLAGFKVLKIPTNDNGIMDVKSLVEVIDENTAGLMVTNPNTLGLYEKNLKQICEIVHSKGGLVYMDGANLNPLLGLFKPASLGVDMVHFNLHKTFATPHGGGGPGGGGLGVKEELRAFLPTPVVSSKDGRWFLNFDLDDSIGQVHSFYGNFGVIVKAYSYIKRLGLNGLKEVSKAAIINANYIRILLKDIYKLPYDNICMHEVVFSGDNQKERGVRTLDIAKAILDRGFHAPTIYFPLIVSEALMIEPTETESKETLDRFVEVMKEIDILSRDNPEILLASPEKTPVSRLDQARAARDLKVKYEH